MYFIAKKKKGKISVMDEVQARVPVSWQYT